MKTPEEVAALAMQIADQYIALDMYDWTGWTDLEQRAVLTVTWEILRRRTARGPQLRAKRLLRSWLTPREMAEFRRSGYHSFTIAASRRYRLSPATGVTHELVQRGTRWFIAASFCLHADEWMPPADISLSHYLLIKTDEGRFLATANRRAR